MVPNVLNADHDHAVEEVPADVRLGPGPRRSSPSAARPGSVHGLLKISLVLLNAARNVQRIGTITITAHTASAMCPGRRRADLERGPLRPGPAGAAVAGLRRQRRRRRRQRRLRSHQYSTLSRSVTPQRQRREREGEEEQRDAHRRGVAELEVAGRRCGRSPWPSPWWSSPGRRCRPSSPHTMANTSNAGDAEVDPGHLDGVPQQRQRDPEEQAAPGRPRRSRAASTFPRDGGHARPRRAPRRSRPPARPAPPSTDQSARSGSDQEADRLQPERHQQRR